MYGHHIDKNAKIHSQCFIGCGSGKLIVGKGSYINYRTFLDLGNDITIGKNCSIAFCCVFVNSTHTLGSGEHRAGRVITAPIVVEDGCWIGANCTIMPGVTIAQGCIIGANALVTRSTEPNGLYIGHPAKRIKDL